ELETYNELKDKFLRESALKRNKQQQKTKEQTSTPSLEVAGVEVCSLVFCCCLFRFNADSRRNLSLSSLYVSNSS
ncbi:unnamed protein product, partial [Rotaria sp. Silwood2]